MVFILNDELIFPDPLLADDNGLLAIGGDLSVDRLLLAYSYGIFPWFNPGDEIMWWASPYRPIYRPGSIKISKSLARTIRKYNFEIKLDSNPEEVIKNCALIKRKGDEGTWITEEFLEVYQMLFEMGYLHSVEVFLNEKMVGGLYGISLGRGFFGESMFHIMPNASKVALFALSEMLADWEFHFIDSQVTNPHSLRMGAYELSRLRFNEMMDKAMDFPPLLGPWKYDFGELKARL